MKKAIAILSVFLFCGLLLTSPQHAAQAVREGLSLCARSVIPSLFPFLAAVGLLLKLGAADWLQGLFAPLMRPLFRMRGVCALPLLTGLLGGYPAGARTAAGLYDEGILTKGEAELLLGFCNNCGPAFLLGFVGTEVLGGGALGMELLLIHVLSALLTGAILCRLAGGRSPAALPCPMPEVSLPFGRAFTQAVTEAADASLRIAAFVVFFRVLVALVPMPSWLTGGLEMVTGLTALPQGGGSLAAAAVLTAWGGLSVHCQTMAVTGELSLRWHWFGKALQALLAGILGSLFMLF